MVKKEEYLKKELEQMVLVETETKAELGTLRTELEFKSKEYSTLSATLAKKDIELNSLKESLECSKSIIQGLEEDVRNHVLEAKGLIEKHNCEAKASEEERTRLENEMQERMALIENLRLETVQIREQFRNCSQNLSEAIITVKDLESRCSTQAATIQSKQVEIDRLREELGTIEQVANEKNLIIQKLQIESENLAAALKDSVESSVSLQSIQDKLGELMSLFGSHQPFVQDDLSRISSDLIRSVDECVKSESQKLAETIISVANKNDSSLKIQQQDEIERLNTQIKQLEKHNNDLLVKVTYFNQHAEEMAEASKKYQSKKEKLTVDLENKLHQQRSEIDTLKTKNALLQQQCNALENSKQTNLERSESNMVSFNERTVDRIIIDNDPLLGYLVEARTPAQTPKLGTHAKHTKTNVPPASNPTNKPARKDSMESVDFDVKVTEWQKEIAKPAKKMPENNPLGTILKRKSIFESRSPQKPHSIVWLTKKGCKTKYYCCERYQETKAK